jgi:hypothetical protein
LYLKVILFWFLRMALAIALAVSNNSMGVTTQLTRPTLQSVHLQAQLLMTLCGPITWGSFCDKPPWWKLPNLHQWQNWNESWAN